MREGIHPKYDVINVKCLCGNTFETRSTKSEISTEICSQCHPFYTGKQKLIDTAGRVERFRRRYNIRLLPKKARGSRVCGSVEGDFVYGEIPLFRFLLRRIACV